MKYIIFLFLFLFSLNANAKQFEKLFYLTNDIANSTLISARLEQIQTHAKSIDILAPQVYQLDENGVMWGTMDPAMIKLAHKNKIKIMPLIINPSFNQEIFHRFLMNPKAQTRAITSMLRLCQQFQLYGIQFDFENIHVSDKKAFTQFFQATANKLHQYGFAISAAVVPRTSDTFKTEYDRWFYVNWSGAYDYQALAKSADFITIMSYDRHTSLTTPGPIAASNWVEKTIQSLLKLMPAHKISLGIPDYSGYWVSGKINAENMPEKYAFRSKEIHMSYPNVVSLLAKFRLSLTWHNKWKTFYAIFNNNEKNEYLFVEDVKSFQAKINLAKRYNLRGISVWKLGLEDPRIWNSASLKSITNSPAKPLVATKLTKPPRHHCSALLMANRND